MHNKCVFYILVFLALIVIPLHSQEEIEPDDGMAFQEFAAEVPAIDEEQVITSVEVIGVKRTKPNVAKYPLEKFIGQKRSEFDENEVFAVVKNMNVLEPVSVELVESEDGIILRVMVEEKWAIFPFPFVYAGSNGETNFGLFFCDLNAFGLRDMAVLGGAYGSNGWSAIGMYSHTPDRREIPGLTAMFMYTHRETEDVNRDEDKIREFYADRLSFSLGANYNFLEFLNGSVTMYFSDLSLKENEEDDDPEKIRLIGIKPRLTVHSNSWDGIFLSSRSLYVEYGYNHAIYGKSFHQIEYRAAFEQSILPGFRLISRSAGIWQSVENLFFEEGPQKAGVNILPNNYSALNYAGASAGLEKYIFKSRWGTLSVQGSWQAVFSHGEATDKDAGDYEFNHGPSGGVLFYLSRLALPAIGSSFSYNMVTGLYQFSFSVGMSF